MVHEQKHYTKFRLTIQEHTRQAYTRSAYCTSHTCRNLTETTYYPQAMNQHNASKPEIHNSAENKRKTAIPVR